jgi:acylphosphatase
MEIQGMKNKIDYLLEFMNSLRRIKINQMQKEIRSVLNQEQEFNII